MPPPHYTKTAPEPRSSTGRSQHKSSAKGKLHTDFQTLYGRREDPIDLFKTQLRVTARANGRTYPIGGMAQEVSWSDDSGASSAASSTIPYMNTQIPLTGSLQMVKPSLSEYRQLVRPVLSASLDKSRHGVARWGALGVVIILEVGFGRHYVPVWAMRVQPTGNSNSAEEVDLQAGTWTLNLADDLQLLALTQDDFKFTKGKKTRRKGYRCDEIAAQVCHQYAIPVKSLARGTAHFQLSAIDTTNTSPLLVIAAAYEKEMQRTGRAFVIRWGAPTRRHPTGGLEIVPMRRNPNLLRFRDQLTEAALSRSQSPDFATSILGRATLKHAKGKHRKITYHYVNRQAVRRFGFIHKIVDFGHVDSMTELHLLTKRAMAFRLTPIRTAQLTHPGIATIRRGDAIRIDIPEEGYAQLDLTSFGTPRTPKSKQSAKMLQDAERADPSLFGLADPSALDATSPANLDLSTVATADTPMLVPLADQGIAFVTGAQHTASAGSYTMDIQTSFVDTLDPQTLKAEMEANIRSAKASSQATKSGTGGSAGSSGGSRWHAVASAEDDSPGTHSACGTIQSRGYSELSTDPTLPLSQLDFAALGHIPCGTQMKITNPANGKTAITAKQDVGAGSTWNGPVSGYAVLGIYPGTRADLGLGSGGPFHVIIERADGGTLKPVRGASA